MKIWFLYSYNFCYTLWLLVSLLLISYILEKTEASFVGTKEIWRREVKNQTLEKDLKTDSDEKLNLLVHILYRRYGIQKPQEENPENIKRTKTPFQNWCRLTKRGNQVSMSKK